jgi:hypothetical protein
MFRAFVKEDNQTPELEKIGKYRALFGLSRSPVETSIKFSKDDLLETIKWAYSRINGYYLLLDAKGTVMAEVS